MHVYLYVMHVYLYVMHVYLYVMHVYLYVMHVYLFAFKCMCCYCFYVGKKLYRAYVCNVTL